MVFALRLGNKATFFFYFFEQIAISDRFFFLIDKKPTHNKPRTDTFKN